MKSFTLFISLFFYVSLFSQEEKPNLELKDIVIVFKTHFDNGYTDYSEAVLQKYSSNLMEASLKALDDSRRLPPDQQFVWTMAAWPMKQILNRCSPELKPRIENAFKTGRFAIHALPFTFETEASDPEKLVRGLGVSTKLSQRYNLPLPYDAKLTDVPSHSWFLPTLLSNAGIKMLHIGCNPASQSPELPNIFWWEGPDGSRLMTIYWGKYYGTSLTPPEGWTHKAWLAIVMTNDNSGPPAPEEVRKVLADARRLAPNARIQIGRISDFYDVIMKEKPQLPVVRGDMPDTWIHGFAASPRELKASRDVSMKIASLESMNSLYNLGAKKNYRISDIIENAYENDLLFDEHTFGMAMSHGVSGTWSYGDKFKIMRANGVFKPIENSWKEKNDRVYQAERTIIPTLNHQSGLLASEIAVEGVRIMVYNPLSWSRDGIATIQKHSDWNTFKALKDLETGEIFNIQNKGNVIQFIAKNVPSLGYKTYVPADEVKQEKSGKLNFSENNSFIENEFMKVTFDPAKGGIVSVKNSKTGKEMVNASEDYEFGNYFYERFSKQITDKYADVYIKNKDSTWGWAHQELGRINLSDESYHSARAHDGNISFSQNINSVSAALMYAPTKELPHDLTIIYTLYKDNPKLEITWSINGKPAEPWPEGGWITFPFNIQYPVFKLGRLGGIVNPATDFIKNSNFDYSFLNTGLAVVNDKGEGFGLCSPDAPGTSLDRPGLWKFSGHFIPKKPNVFINLYNNQWSTNFTEWVEGSWSAKVYVWFIDKYNNESSIITPSEELRNPLITMLASGTKGRLPATAQSVSFSRKAVKVTAFGPDSSSKGYLLRFWEEAGDGGNCKVQLSSLFRFKTAQVCNLRGEPAGKPIAIVNGVFELELGAYKPASFILK